MRAKMYANRHGKAQGVKNNLQIAMSVEEADAIAEGNKSKLNELLGVLREAVAGDRTYFGSTTDEE